MQRKFGYIVFTSIMTTVSVTNALTNLSNLQRSLIRQGLKVRETISTSTSPPNLQDIDNLSYPSGFIKRDGSGYRGFCNWLIPQHLMVGSYPGQNPSDDGPTAEQAHNHISSIVQDAKIDLFCSLQSEIPCQTNDAAWIAVDGAFSFQEDDLRRQFPNAFTHYAPIVRSVAARVSSQNSPSLLTFLHAPIDDLNVPNSEPLLSLLSDLLRAMEEDRVIYLHCWGGRGRAGLVGACLLSIVYPDMDASHVLDLVQAGYDTRAGAADMPPALSKSPQTEQQRQFVRNFIRELHQ